MKTVTVTDGEYILNIENNRANRVEEWQPLVRCKDCKHFSQTTLGMTYACWLGGSSVWGETGEHAGHTLCTRIDDPMHYCSKGVKA